MRKSNASCYVVIRAKPLGGSGKEAPHEKILIIKAAMVGSLCLFLICMVVGGTIASLKQENPISQAEVKPEPDNFVYSPVILEQMAKYKPTFTEAEEPFWNKAPGFQQLYSRRDQPTYLPGSLTPVCMREALKGNPRGMVCLGELTMFMPVENYLTTKEGLPNKATSDKYWFNKAAEYMGKGWVYLRRAELASGSRKLSYQSIAEDSGSLLGAFYRCASDSGVVKLADAGLPEAMAWVASFMSNPQNANNPNYAPNDEKAQKYIYGAAYACSEDAAKKLSGYYDRGILGLEPNMFMSSLWAHLANTLEAERTGDPLFREPEAYTSSPEEAVSVRKHVQLILGQCAQVREEILQKQRPRWTKLTEELQKDMEVMIKALPPEPKPKRSWFW